MSLTSALSVITSSLIANSSQSAVVSRNVANANTAGYSREIAGLVTTSYGGVDVALVSRQANAFLQERASEATSDAAYHDAVLSGLNALVNTVDDSATVAGESNGRSPSAMISSLRSALQLYASSPGDGMLASQAVSAASDLTNALNSASATVQKTRAQADSQMAQSVATINSLLSQFAGANAAVVAGLHGTGDVASAQDARDKILSQLSEQIGITTTTQPDGAMSIYTDSGVTLFQGEPRAAIFNASNTLGPGDSGDAVVIDGVPVTGAGSPMKIRSGALAGFASLRDAIAPQYQAQLDQIAGSLVGAFAETSRTGGAAGISIPGLFTAPGLSAPPSADAVTGLAASIQVAASVDPSRGGSAFLLRDGAIGAPGDNAYSYNVGGGSAFNARLLQLADGLSADRSFGSAGGLSDAANVIEYANASVGWLQSSVQAASQSATVSSAVATQATAALSNGVGVNLDAEMTNMLSIENSYATSAKLLTTVNAMFTALLNAA